MSGRLIYTDVFLKDLESVCGYISEDNADETAKFAKDIFAATEKLSEFPLSGTLPKEKPRQLRDYRMLVFGNYIIYYQFESKTEKIYLHRIVHGARYKF